jgi:predicted aspartyl protease
VEQADVAIMNRAGPFSRRLLGALVALLGCAAWPALAATPTEPPPVTTQVPLADDTVAHAESLKIAEDPSQRLTLAVMINGRGPFDFLVDTGSDRTVISRELAASLALPAGPSVTVHEITGVDDENTVVIDHLTIGDRVIDHIEAPVLTAKDLGAAGMLGVDALHNLHVVMDFKAMRMSSAPSRPEPFDGHTIVVHGRSRFGQLVLVDSKVHGVRVFVVLDSGSQVSIGNPALLKLLTGRRTSSTPLITTEITSVTGRKATVELDDIAEANVGGVTIRNMPLAFAQLPIFAHFGLSNEPALLLGMDVLSRCQRVSVDLRRREATFTLD